MKNILLSPVFFLLIACNAENTVVNEKISISQENETVKTDVVLEYPQKGDDTALNSIRQHVADLLITDYKGQLNDGKKFLQQFAAEKTAELTTAPAEDSPAEDYAQTFKSTYTANVKVVVQTPRFITYEKNAYVFTGGAHGMPEWGTASIRKSDGVLLNEHILNERVSSNEFKQLLKQGVISYYKALKGAYYQCEFQPETLQSEIFEEVDINNLPIPQSKPFLTEDGVGFVYMPYEIACYADGQISFVLPYDILKPYLTAEVWNLISNKNENGAVRPYMNDNMAEKYKKYLSLPEHKICE